MTVLGKADTEQDPGLHGGTTPSKGRREGEMDAGPGARGGGGSGRGGPGEAAGLRFKACPVSAVAPIGVDFRNPVAYT